MATATATLIFDTSPLNHFARAGELAVLRDLVAGFRCVTTRAVHDELQRGAEQIPVIGDALDLTWIEIVPCDRLEELYLFAEYMNRLGNVVRNAGEASVLAWAEAHTATAYVDDQVACNVGRSRGVRVHRTLQLVVQAVRDGRLTEVRAQGLIKVLADSDARLPQQARDDLFGWARAQDPPLI